ncbi:hypothetical protein CFP56_034004 [Quercus suber]|uniref:Uncharacterized protein n=1 Tax=Quercus suber TaxID=58331 RepID=A0AAW0JDA6_QUESU
MVIFTPISHLLGLFQQKKGQDKLFQIDDLHVAFVVLKKESSFAFLPKVVIAIDYIWRVRNQLQHGKAKPDLNF